uniref:Replication protein A 70 kDa DNA-binding subunit B/D first OB fold domain-containing protein n=1 Tax=Glycine max TaxID=3847 RepID=K7LQH6_SOYBN
MAHIADKIKTIDGSKETLKLVVRITELWFVGTPGRSKQAEMIIVDSDGDQIHVVCKQDKLKTWKMNLKEGCTYVMHNFRVSMNDEQYRVCDHPYKLTFIGVTVVRQCEFDGLPFKNYRFANFSDVVASLLVC